MMNTRKFSINCKVDSVANELSTASGRTAALERFRALGVSKVWLEGYRNKFAVSEEKLRSLRDFLTENGLETGCVIVPSSMSDREGTAWASVTCYSDPAAARRMEECVTRAAELFDEILFDDFLFTNCACDECERLRGDRPAVEFRTELLRNFEAAHIVAPAKKVNPRVRLIIKYPCWYPSFRRNGYDLKNAVNLFDMTWAGTETRDNGMPQSKAAWIQRWLVENGKCGGGWFDPLSCSPETCVEQARGTILGGADEVLYHCYDYFFPNHATFAQDGGGLSVPENDGCAAALIRERDGLKRLHALLADAVPFGVADPRKADAGASADGEIQPWFAMSGIPTVPRTELKDEKSFILSDAAADFGPLREIVPDGAPYLLTRHAAEIFGVSDPARLLPDDAKPVISDAMRNALLSPFGLEFHAPWKVALNLYCINGRTACVIQNFNGTPAEVELKGLVKAEKYLSLPDNASAQKTCDGKYLLAAHALLALTESC